MYTPVRLYTSIMRVLRICVYIYTYIHSKHAFSSKFESCYKQRKGYYCVLIVVNNSTVLLDLVLALYLRQRTSNPDHVLPTSQQTNYKRTYFLSYMHCTLWNFAPDEKCMHLKSWYKRMDLAIFRCITFIYIHIYIYMYVCVHFLFFFPNLKVRINFIDRVNTPEQRQAAVIYH